MIRSHPALGDVASRRSRGVNAWLARVAMVTVLITPHAPAAEPGTRAPGLDAVTWIAGGDATIGDGHVAVVEFWATWNPGSRDSLAHLAGLRARYRDRVLAIALSDEGRHAVEGFVAGLGAPSQTGASIATARRVPDHIGVIEPSTKDAWVDDADIIPYAVIVAGDGMVQWAGRADDLDVPLAQVVAGTWDADHQQQMATLRARLEALFNGDGEPDYEQALALSSRIIALDPGSELGLRATLGIAHQLGRHELYEATLAALPIADLPTERLDAIAWDLLTIDDLAWRSPEQALRIARAAYEREPRSAHVADTWARALYQLGLVDEALAIERDAAVDASADEAAAIAATIAFYERVLALQAGARATTSSRRAMPDPAMP